MGKHEILAVLTLAAGVREIDGVHVGQFVEGIQRVSTVRHLDGRAVHVEFPVADLVVPCPG